MITAPLQVEGATFKRHGFTLGPVDLAIAPGTVVAAVGPNGSGKTTLVRLVAGLLGPTSGLIEVAGDEPRAGSPHTLRQVGLASDDLDSLPGELTARELWALHASAHAAVGGDARQMCTEAETLATELDLDPPRAPISTFSHGMRKKAQLVAAMLHAPGLLVLDEPTNGLDPLTAYRLGQLVRARAGAGCGVLVTTHDLAWVQHFSDEVHVLRRGRVVAAGPTTELLAQGPSSTLLDRFVAIVDGGEP